MSETKQTDASTEWHCGGWEGAERETLRFMQNMTFEQKLDWLEQAQRLVAAMHGWEAALQPSGTLVKPRAGQPPADSARGVVAAACRGDSSR